MVSTEGHATTQRLDAASKISAFLGASATDVDELLVQGRLERTLMATLRSRGTSITPTVKNSVQSMVRSIEREPVATGKPLARDLQSISGATATIMFTDIVGSTSIMERLGDRAGREALVMHDEIVRHEVPAYEGVEVKALGDGFMLTFRSVGRGLACAAAIQKDFALFSERQPAARIAVRMGLNVGGASGGRGGHLRNVRHRGGTNIRVGPGRTGTRIPGCFRLGREQREFPVQAHP